MASKLLGAERSIRITTARCTDWKRCGRLGRTAEENRRQLQIEVRKKPRDTARGFLLRPID